MKVLRLAEGEGNAVMRAAHALRLGGVILYPTDTLYGLGADAFSDEAVDRVYEIKGRDQRKPMHALCADMSMVEEYAEVNELAQRLAAKFLPGALTLVLKKKPHIEGGIARGIDTIGVRIPDNSFCLDLARSFGKPFTATSANIANQTTGLTVEKILEQIAERTSLIDVAIDAGELPMRPPSTVVDVSNDVIRVLRVGAIPAHEVQA
jgi:L-threonylcarbamoyladenylate synthase